MMGGIGVVPLDSHDMYSKLVAFWTTSTANLPDPPGGRSTWLLRPAAGALDIQTPPAKVFGPQKHTWMRYALYKKQQIKVLTCELSKEGIWNTFLLLNLTKKSYKTTSLKAQNTNQSHYHPKRSHSASLCFSASNCWCLAWFLLNCSMFSIIFCWGKNFNFHIWDFRKKMGKMEGRIGQRKSPKTNRRWRDDVESGCSAAVNRFHQKNRGKRIW